MLVGLMMGSVVGGCFPYRDYHSDGRYQKSIQPLSAAEQRYRPPPDRQQQHSEH